MKFVIYDNKHIANLHMKKLVGIIHENFIELSDYEELKHTPRDILDTIHNEQNMLILCFDNKMKKIHAYLLGYFTKLNDGRNVFYISYIYVNKFQRGKGLGKKLMQICEEDVKAQDYEGILLTCDTNDRKVVNFYETLGYMLDFNLRRYTRHDIFFKQI